MAENCNECSIAWIRGSDYAEVSAYNGRAAALQEESISEYFEGETDAFEFAIKIVKGGGVE